MTSFDELRRSGAPALDPAAWRAPLNVGPSGPSGSVGAADGRQATMLWVGGRSLVDEREVMVPAGAAFLRHRPPPGCPTVFRAGSAGVAAHATRGQAVEHALLEVLERDLAARSWFGTGPVCVANPPTRWPSPLDSGLEVLGLEALTLALPGPSGSACLVTCLHSGARRQQSFGARCVVGDDDGRWSAGFERAAYEALMVRWSMATPVARRAWDDMRARDDPTLPGNALEHALWTFHVQDSLGHWLSQAVDHGIGTPAEEDDLASAVAAHTGEDVVVVDSTVAIAGAEDGVVVRVVAPGAERLLGEAGHGSLPHPFG